jgi:hypothetical protein
MLQIIFLLMLILVYSQQFIFFVTFETYELAQ